MVAEVIHLADVRARRQHECGTVTCATCGCETLLARPMGETGERTACPICHAMAPFDPTGFAETMGGLTRMPLRARQTR